MKSFLPAFATNYFGSRDKLSDDVIFSKHSGSSLLFGAITGNAWEVITQTYYTKLAQSIDPIDTTITFFAEILASGIIKSKDKDGNDVTDTDLLVELLRNPNENQNIKEFIKEWLYYFYSHGWCYVVPQSSAVGYEYVLGKGTKTQLYNLDPDQMKWGNFWGSIMNFLGLGVKEKIQFDYKPLGLTKISYTNCISFIDVRQNPEKPYIGISRLLSLRPNIENYSLSIQGKRNMLRRSGSQLISLDAKADDYGMDTMIGTGQNDEKGDPIMTTQKQKLEDQIRATGIGSENMGIIFANLPLKVQSLSDGLEKIDYDKQGIQDARVIMNKFNLPKEFQNLTIEPAKFLNRDAAMMEVVQNIMQPVGNFFCEKMKEKFKHPNTLYMDFSHLPIFSEDQDATTTTKQNQYNLFKQMLTDEVITDVEFKQLLKENGIIK